MSLPEFMVRVKLPRSDAYHSSPSGDTEYEMAYQKALKAAVPENFVVIEERLGVSRPKDSEGYTYVRLRCKSEENLLANCLVRIEQLEKTIAEVKKLVN